jgi:hypothetical protein
VLYRVTDEPEVVERWDGSAWVHWAGMPRGSSFPAQPAYGDDRDFLRTDIRDGVVFYYDGTYWLSRQPFHGDASVSNATASAYVGMAAVPTDLDLYVVTVSRSSYVATTNDGSNYWGLDLHGYKNDNTNDTLHTGNTSGDTVATWTDHSDLAVGALVSGGTGATDVHTLRMSFVKTGSPGGLYAYATVEYRLRAA